MPFLADVGRALAQTTRPRWRWMTLVVLLACATCIRLGFWQLDRLAQRRATSAELTSRLTAPPVVLTGSDLGSQTALDALQYHTATVRGAYDLQHEVALTNEIWDGKLGLHLVTPLLIQGSDRAVMIDRGWIPAQDSTPASWAKYRPAPAGPPNTPVEVAGWIRLARQKPGPPVGSDRLVDDISVARLAPETGRPLLPVYLMESPDPTSDPTQAAPPFRKPPVADLGDGVHLIVAIQWYAFSVIIAAGYLAYAHKQRSGASAEPAPAIQPSRGRA